jgi:hypothetical protein
MNWPSISKRCLDVHVFDVGIEGWHPWRTHQVGKGGRGSPRFFLYPLWSSFNLRNWDEKILEQLQNYIA